MRATAKVITESSAGRRIEIDAPDGSALIDLCDEWGAPIPFNCRSAACGTCRIEIVEGSDELTPAAQDEIDLLDIYDVKPPGMRLACQAVLRPGATRVWVKAIQEE